MGDLVRLYNEVITIASKPELSDVDKNRLLVMLDRGDDSLNEAMLSQCILYKHDSFAFELIEKGVSFNSTVNPVMISPVEYLVKYRDYDTIMYYDHVVGIKFDTGSEYQEYVIPYTLITNSMLNVNQLKTLLIMTARNGADLNTPNYEGKSLVVKTVEEYWLNRDDWISRIILAYFLAPYIGKIPLGFDGRERHVFNVLRPLSKKPPSLNIIVRSMMIIEGCDMELVPPSIRYQNPLPGL